MSNIEFDYFQHPGDRKIQQDAMGIFSLNQTFHAIVCDGMGGLECGEYASKVAVNSYIEKVKTLSGKIRNGDISKIADYMDYKVDLEGKKKHLRMGSTAVFCMIEKSRMLWGSVGDSRIYLIRNHEMMQLSEDHTISWLNLEKTEALEEKSAEKKNEGALISYLGMKGIRYMDLSDTYVVLQKNDLILLCSDGLYKSVEPEKMESVFKKYQDIHICKSILKQYVLADQSKKQDNTTFILMYVK